MLTFLAGLLTRLALCIFAAVVFAYCCIKEWAE